MKVALLITGQLRTYKLCKYFIKHYIIDSHDTDVFMSVDLSNALCDDKRYIAENSSTTEVQDAVAFFKPIQYAVVDSYDSVFEEHKTNLNSSALKRISYEKYKVILEQFYVVQKAYTLLQEHIEKTSVKYDIVIRCRFDTIFIPNSTTLSSMYIHNENSSYAKYTEDGVYNAQTEIGILGGTLDLSFPNRNEIGVSNFSSEWVDEHIWVHSVHNIKDFYSYYTDLFQIINDLSSENINFESGPYAEIFFRRFLRNRFIRTKHNNFKRYFCRPF
jgi:hypothetical protein